MSEPVSDAPSPWLGVFVELETNMRKKRQLEGIERAKANGIYAGKRRPATDHQHGLFEVEQVGLALIGVRPGAGQRA